MTDQEKLADPNAAASATTGNSEVRQYRLPV
jgi:hypothetical protein